jgi:peptidoglycan/LPS O-acetylase OafA/YrhL
MAPPRIGGLDGLRGLAALAVLVFHAWLYSGPDPGSAQRSSASDYVFHELRLGLVLFFALSGFVLFRPWVRAALDRTERPQLGRYLRSRAARILPAYYLALVGAVVLLWGLAGESYVRLPDAGELWRFVLFVQNYSGATVMSLNPPTWTLVIEVSFYLALPLLGWLLLRLPARRWALLALPLALIGAGLWFTWYSQLIQLPLPWRKTLPSMLPYFGAGMAAAVLVHGRRLGPWATRLLLLTGSALVVVDALLLTAQARHTLLMPELTIIRDLPAAVGFAAILAALAAGPPGRIAGSRPMVRLGEISYGLYLWNVPLAIWLRAHGLLPADALPAALVLFAVTTVFATASWLLVERRAIAWAARQKGLSPQSHPRRLRGLTPLSRFR